MNLNQLFSTFYLIFRFFTDLNRRIFKKFEKTFSVGFFCGEKKKRVILWPRVILWALEEYTKFKFLHFSSKYLEKSSPKPNLKKDWGFWVLDLSLKINSPSKLQGVKKSAAKKNLNLRIKITRPNPKKNSNFFG
jgi:hypothetical protein